MKKLVLERLYKNCPRMVSGVKFDVLLPYDDSKFLRAINLLAYRHPFLNATVHTEEDTFSYNLDKKVIPFVVESTSVLDFEKDFTQFENACRNFSVECLCKFFVYKHESSFSLLVVAHKILTDAKGLMALIQDFILAYQDLLPEKVVVPRLIENLKDLPKENYVTLKEKKIIQKVNRDIKKRKVACSESLYKEYHYSLLENNPLGFAYRKLPESYLDGLKAECEKNNVSILAYFIALVCKNFYIPYFLFSVDVRNCLYWYVQGSLGNFNSFVFFDSKNYSKKNIFELAREIERQLMFLKHNDKTKCSALAKILLLDPRVVDVLFPFLGYFSSEKSLKRIAKSFKLRKKIEYMITDVGTYSIPEIDNVVFLESPFPITSLNFTLLTVNDQSQISCRYQKKDYSQEKFAKYLDDMIHSL